MADPIEAFGNDELLEYWDSLYAASCGESDPLGLKNFLARLTERKILEKLFRPGAGAKGEGKGGGEK